MSCKLYITVEEDILKLFSFLQNKIKKILYIIQTFYNSMG